MSSLAFTHYPNNVVCPNSSVPIVQATSDGLHVEESPAQEPPPQNQPSPQRADSDLPSPPKRRPKSPKISAEEVFAQLEHHLQSPAGPQLADLLHNNKWTQVAQYIQLETSAAVPRWLCTHRVALKEKLDTKIAQAHAFQVGLTATMHVYSMHSKSTQANLSFF